MFIGIDIGGHKINSVLVKNNKIVKRYRVLTKSKTNKKIIIGQIFDCIHALMAEVRPPSRGRTSHIKGIGLGVPGPVDSKKGIVLNPPNLSALKNVSLVDLIRKEFKIKKVIIENDTNCFGLAEAVLGVCKKTKNFVGLTLGTGIGGCLIIDGNLYRGNNGNAGEFGHMTIKQGGRKCSCGNKGCLEAYVSGKGIMKTAQEINCKGATPTEIARLAEKNNKIAIKVYKITGEYLGSGLANIVDILNPEIIVIGGGIVNDSKLFFEPARKVMKKNILSSLAKNTKIVKTKFGEDAGALGATLLF